MSKFRIIPVIDLLNSQAVHAIKGERNKYKPLKSIFSDSSDPIKIIKILEQNFGFEEFYIADLDSIIDNKPNLALLSKILNISSIKIMLDPGIHNKKDILKYEKLRLNKIILGLETINNLNEITECFKILGKNKIIVSIDMYNGKIISNKDVLKIQNPIDIINKLEKIGINELILLDLFRVGQKIGGIPPLYLKIREKYKGNVLIGGGIKDYKDILELSYKSFSGVLIGTSLYDGTIKIEDLKKNAN